MRDGSGYLGTIGGTECAMSGCLDAGSTHLGGVLFESPPAGFRAVAAMSTLPDIGVRQNRGHQF